MHKAWLTCQAWFMPNSGFDMSAFCDLWGNLNLYYIACMCVCLHVYLRVNFHINPSIVCMLCTASVDKGLTWTNGYSTILSCCIKGVALSAWNPQCYKDLGTATKLWHYTGKMDDFVQPKNMKFFPLYKSLCLCLRRIILVKVPRLK